jgi:hypothetical protein
MIQKFIKTRSIFLYSFKITVLFCLFVFMQGCMKDDFSKISAGSWGPDIAVPVINEKFVITDFLKGKTNEYVKEDSATHFLTVKYNGTPFSQNANTVLRVDSQTASFGIKMPAGLSAFSGFKVPKDTVITDTSTNISKFTNANNVQIETLRIRSGSLQISLVSQFKFSGEVAFTFPTFKDGTLKNILVVVPFTYVPGVSPTTANSSADLMNAIADMSYGGTTYNTLPISYKITARLKNGDLFDGSQKITVNLLMDRVIFSYIDGYFGSLPLDMHESFPIGLFNYIKSGSLNLKAPKADFTINNSYGLPIDMLFTKLQVQTKNNDSVPFKGSQINDTIHFLNPSLSEVGQVKSTLISINPSTSNIATVISKSPVKFEYVGKVTSNPKGKTTTKNFITDSSKASVDVNISIPLWGTASDFTTLDTFPLKMPAANILESMTIKINTENGFPLDVDLQLFFADSLNHITDTLMFNNNRFLRSGVIDTDGNVISPTFTTITADIDKSRFPRISKARKILLVGVLNTTINADKTQPVIRVSSKNYLGVKLGVRTKLKFGK